MTRRFNEIGVRVPLRSAGLLEGGTPSPAEVVNAGARRGVDLRGHRSVQVEPWMLDEADLIVTMARSHVRELSVREQRCWPKSFTLRELVRRGSRVGPRQPEQPFSEWLASVREGRRTGDLFGADGRDDVLDPMGGSQEAFDEMVEILDVLTAELADLLFPVR